jgi:hypothetical protein
MAKTYIISPDVFLVVLKDQEGNTYSCTPDDTIQLDGYSITVPGIYDWYLYFNTYADWTEHKMDYRFNAKKFHKTGKKLAKLIRLLMDYEDELYYFRSINDDSGIIKRRSKVRHILILGEDK